MDGVLLIDKPAGPTSHDVVQRLRRLTRERRIGHTGTLDPAATGLLPLVIGRATRLASVLSGGDKTYDATIRLGYATTTDDAAGTPLGQPAALPADAQVIEAALAGFRGTFEQRPPSHSAKKIDGRKAYTLARQSRPVVLNPVPVTVRRLEMLDQAGDRVRLRVTATAGFYVRALARDLGTALGCGGHLLELRRTASGPFQVGDALSLDEAERLGAGIEDRLLQPAAALPQLAAVTVTPAGWRRVQHGNRIDPEHVEGAWVPVTAGPDPVKVLAPGGALIALAVPRGGALHPTVVLG